MRGVVQRTILQDLVQRVGHDIPAQELFDVIVGTGTGMKVSNPTRYYADSARRRDITRHLQAGVDATRSTTEVQRISQRRLRKTLNDKIAIASAGRTSERTCDASPSVQKHCHEQRT